MARPSPFFARIRGDVLAIVATVPPGRVVTFRDVGAHLDVVPRHVAYLLATPDAADAARFPWHRAVPDDGVLTPDKRGADGARQRDLLADEGHVVGANGALAGLAAARVTVDTLPHGVAKQTRPADAPVARRRGR
jgi:methylated-DNA-protein-cysteine methyltransferase-like protein